MRPYFGPSTTRDAFSDTVDMVGDPLGWVFLATHVGWGGALGTGLLNATVRLSELKQAEDVSIDFYPFLRSAYYQTRRADLREALGLPPLVESPATTPSR